MEGRCGSLLTGGDVHSEKHGKWCPAFVESEQASVTTSRVTQRWVYSLNGSLATSGLMSPPVVGMDPGCGCG